MPTYRAPGNKGHIVVSGSGGTLAWEDQAVSGLTQRRLRVCRLRLVVATGLRPSPVPGSLAGPGGRGGGGPQAALLDV